MEEKYIALQKKIGKELKEERLKRNLYLSEVQDLTGLKIEHISRTENGKFNLTLRKLHEYAAAYNLEPVITFKKIKK